MKDALFAGLKSGCHRALFHIAEKGVMIGLLALLAFLAWKLLKPKLLPALDTLNSFVGHMRKEVNEHNDQKKIAAF